MKRRYLLALLLVGACGLGLDDLQPISGLWWGGCCAESTLAPGIRWELSIEEGPAGSVSGKVRATGLGERSRLGWEYEGRVSGSVDDGSVVLHLVYEDLTPHRFDGRRISEGRMDGSIADLGDVTFTRPGYK